MSLKGLVFCMTGTLSQTRAKVTELIEKNEGEVKASITNTVNILLATEDEVTSKTQKVVDALDKKIPIVSEDFIIECIAKKKQVDTDPYLLAEKNNAKRATPATESEAPANKKVKVEKKANEDEDEDDEEKKEDEDEDKDKDEAKDKDKDEDKDKDKDEDKDEDEEEDAGEDDGNVDEAATKLIKKLKETKLRRCLVPVLEAGEADVRCSKIGGLPYFASDDEWPECSMCSDAPMLFFFQIDMATLPKEFQKLYGHSDGLLQFFICSSDSCCGWEAFDKGSLTRVVKVNGPGKKITIPDFETEISAKRIKNFVIKEDLPDSEDAGDDINDDIV